LTVPIAWFAQETIEAGRGAPSPDAAADSYLVALSYNNEDGLLNVLDDDRQDALLAQWHAYRAAMDGTDPPPSRIGGGALTVGPIVNGRAEVSTDVSATWWDKDGGGGGYNSDSLTWRFATRKDNGWQVTAVEPPAWCGGYVHADSCARKS
jgi:hypothetical protein